MQSIDYHLLDEVLSITHIYPISFFMLGTQSIMKHSAMTAVTANESMIDYQHYDHGGRLWGRNSCIVSVNVGNNSGMFGGLRKLGLLALAAVHLLTATEHPPIITHHLPNTAGRPSLPHAPLPPHPLQAALQQLLLLL
jgi:hypothetical protein